MNSLLMTAENGQKVYDGRKTATRRTTGLDYPNAAPHEFDLQAVQGEKYFFTRPRTGAGGVVTCPYRVGELRYIREAHYLYGRWKRQGKTKTGRPKYRFLADRRKGACYPSNPPPRVCTNRRTTGWFRRSGLFMPEWAARTVVKIVSVRAERVQKIGQGSACAEGCPVGVEPIGWFAQLWDSIHGAGAWERNDWVWVIGMERVHGAD